MDRTGSSCLTSSCVNRTPRITSVTGCRPGRPAFSSPSSAPRLRTRSALGHPRLRWSRPRLIHVRFNSENDRQPSKRDPALRAIERLTHRSMTGGGATLLRGVSRETCRYHFSWIWRRYSTIACMRFWMTGSGSQERSMKDSNGSAVGFLTFLGHA